MMYEQSALQGLNKCHTAEENGVSILHGNALSFVKVRKLELTSPHYALILGKGMLMIIFYSCLFEFIMYI